MAYYFDGTYTDLFDPGNSAYDIALTDYNGDGRLDIVVSTERQVLFCRAAML